MGYWPSLFSHLTVSGEILILKTYFLNVSHVNTGAQINLLINIFNP